MGKGDIKTTKGKRVRGSYGITRPRPKKHSSANSQKQASKKTAE